MTLVCYKGDTEEKIDQDIAYAILTILLDIGHRKIIRSIKDEPKSILQISIETGITLSKTYRKIHDLVENKLVYVSGDINSDRKKVLRYKIKIKQISLIFNDKIEVRIYFNDFDSEFE